MFKMQKEQIENYKKMKNINVVLFTIIKLVIAYCLITYVEYGMFIVIAYILYSLENISSLQYINTQEINLQLNILHQEIDNIKKEK